jgi:hypothetical protein
MEVAKDGETFLSNVVLKEAKGTDKKEGLKEAGSEARCPELEEGYKAGIERQENEKKLRGRPNCDSTEHEYVLRKEREG